MNATFLSLQYLQASACIRIARGAFANASSQAPPPVPNPPSLSWARMLYFQQALMGIPMQAVQEAPSKATALYLPLQAAYGIFQKEHRSACFLHSRERVTAESAEESSSVATSPPHNGTGTSAVAAGWHWPRRRPGSPPCQGPTQHTTT